MKTGKYKDDSMTILLETVLAPYFIIASMIPLLVIIGRIMLEKVDYNIYIYICNIGKQIER